MIIQSGTSRRIDLFFLPLSPLTPFLSLSSLIYFLYNNIYRGEASKTWFRLVSLGFSWFPLVFLGFCCFQLVFSLSSPYFSRLAVLSALAFSRLFLRILCSCSHNKPHSLTTSKQAVFRRFSSFFKNLEIRFRLVFVGFNRFSLVFVGFNRFSKKHNLSEKVRFVTTILSDFSQKVGSRFRIGIH